MTCARSCARVDGLWDVMSSADAIAFVRERLKR
jgi:hypothetical protein